MNTPTVKLIPVDRIRVVNPRSRDKKKFEEIVASIAAVGLKKPITVASAPPDPDGGEWYDLVCGQGRLEAFQALGQKQIPALICSLSKSDGLLASLIENIARRRVRSLDQVRLIQWMKDQGQDCASVARKTGLSEDYVKHVLTMLKNGEERLLEGVLHGVIPVSVAMQIASSPDQESQKILVEAYQGEGMNQKSVATLKRILDHRRNFGRNYGPRPRAGAPRTPAQSLVQAYKEESQRQRVLVRKDKLCEARLLSLSAAFKVLIEDEDFATLLRAEKMETMPKFLAERARLVA
jgi:ParB family chromosome partitioning protein